MHQTYGARFESHQVSPCRKKKTGKWLAQELGVSECTVSRWASNKAQPNLSSLNVIAKLLGVEMKDLLRS